MDDIAKRFFPGVWFASSCAAMSGSSEDRYSYPARVLVCAEDAHVLTGLSKLIRGEWPRLHLVCAVSGARDAEAFVRTLTVEAAVVYAEGAEKSGLSALLSTCRNFHARLLVLRGTAAYVAPLPQARDEVVLPGDAPRDSILAALYEAVGKPNGR